jgi:DNA-binding transcriptional regulator GbsR (MarR family)
MRAGHEALRKAWVEEFALVLEGEGLPRMAGRIFGWLLVCEPAEQTMEELGAALGGSKASMSTMTRLLAQAELVERARRPGERRDRFRIPPEHWDRIMRGRVQSLSATTALLGRAVELVRDQPPEARRRVDDLYSLYTYFERELPGLLARWSAGRRDELRDAVAPGARRSRAGARRRTAGGAHARRA